jgi:hypothetical protein
MTKKNEENKRNVEKGREIKKSQGKLENSEI